MVDLSYIELGLVAGGLLAIASAWYGRRESSSWDEVMLFLGFIVGIVMIAIGILGWMDGGYEVSTIFILILLGASLFLKAIKGIKLAAVLALIAGVAVGYGLYWVSKAFELDFINTTVILVAAFIVMLIIYVMFKFVEDLMDFGGMVLGFRPVQFIMGLVALAEAGLILAGYSVWYFIA